jgi:hypothetical protein
LARLRSGERALFVPPGTDASASAASSPQELRLDRPAADELSVGAAPNSTGWAFLSEKWYPGWREADGAEVVRGNLTFFAVHLDGRASGAYRLAYRPWWRVPALVASGASLLAAALLVARQLRRGPASG